jgi:uncharacterized coiled-coil DUF342 family protein
MQLYELEKQFEMENKNRMEMTFKMDELNKERDELLDDIEFYAEYRNDFPEQIQQNERLKTQIKILDAKLKLAKEDPWGKERYPQEFANLIKNLQNKKEKLDDFQIDEYRDSELPRFYDIAEDIDNLRLKLNFINKQIEEIQKMLDENKKVVDDIEQQIQDQEKLKKIYDKSQLQSSRIDTLE